MGGSSNSNLSLPHGFRRALLAFERDELIVLANEIGEVMRALNQFAQYQLFKYLEDRKRLLGTAREEESTLREQWRWAFHLF